MRVGIIHGGGLGTRLRPITNTCNKHTIPIAGRPMIEYPIRRLVSEGITDIIMCINGPFGHQMPEMVGDGSRYGCRVTYIDCNHLGPGTARSLIGVAEQWTITEDFVTVFGDGIFFAPLSCRQYAGPHIYLMDLPPGGPDDPSKYAQARVCGGRVVELVEKPPTLVSTLVQAGAFIFTPEAFAIAHELDRCTDPKIEIGMTDINQVYAARGVLTYSLIHPGDYIDCGTPDALVEAGERVTAFRSNGDSIF